ncbi:MAG: glycosyltransferase family 2 protein [Bacteroidota bacterium]
MDYLSRYSVKEVIKPLSERKPIELEAEKIPKISVITASFNQGQFLERTILSVINQNYSNTEFIIIDGGSTDNTLEIIEKYKNYITYWVSEKDNGQSDAINKGFKIATGDLLCFQNSDDLFCLNSFKLLSAFYKINPNFDIYFGDLLFVDANDDTLEILKTSNFDIRSQILEGMQVFNQSMYFKKSLGEEHGYLDESLRFVLDYENILRWAQNGAKLAKIRHLMGAFRIHEDAKTNNLQDVRRTEHEAVKARYFNLLFPNKRPSKLVYLLLRVKKLLYFILNSDFGYIKYRYSLKK